MYQGILKFYEALTTDGWIGDRIVMSHDEVETHLEQIIIQPFGNGRLHIAQLLVCLSSVQSLQQIRLTCEPIANGILVGIIRWRQFEGITHTTEGFRIYVFGIEPAEALVQIGVRPHFGAVKQEGSLFAHFPYRFKELRERCCYRIPLTDVCM